MLFDERLLYCGLFYTFIVLCFSVSDQPERYGLQHLESLLASKLCSALLNYFIWPEWFDGWSEPSPRAGGLPAGGRPTSFEGTHA
jgi:hypothetical protein